MGGTKTKIKQDSDADNAMLYHNNTVNYICTNNSGRETCNLPIQPKFDHIFFYFFLQNEASIMHN
jgi:hypothetical protein